MLEAQTWFEAGALQALMLTTKLSYYVQYNAQLNILISLEVELGTM